MKFQHLYREIHFFMNNLAENSNFQHFLTEKGRFQVLFEPFWTETDHDILVTIFDIFIFKKYGTNSKFYRTVPPLYLCNDRNETQAYVCNKRTRGIQIKTPPFAV